MKILQTIQRISYRPNYAMSLSTKSELRVTSSDGQLKSRDNSSRLFANREPSDVSFTAVSFFVANEIALLERSADFMPRHLPYLDKYLAVLTH